MPLHGVYPIEKKQEAKSLYIQGFLPSRIAIQLSLPVKTIHVWVTRGGWRNLRDSATLNGHPTLIKAEHLDRAVAGVSAVLRQKLAEVLQLHADALGLIKAKPDIKHLAAVADVIEALARSAKIVHDWGQGGQAGLILIEHLRKQEAPGSPASVSCGPETPIQSIVKQDIVSDVPQVAEVVDVETVASAANST